MGLIGGIAPGRGAPFVEWLFSTDGGQALLALLGLSLLALVATLFAMILLARRQHGRDIREIVVAVEGLRSGQMRQRAGVDPRSPLAVVSDAVQRLGQDLATRRRDADGADQQLQAVMEGAPDLGMLSTDTHWEIRSFSAGASALFDWPEEAIRGQALSELFSEDAWREILPRLVRRGVAERGLQSRAILERRGGIPFEGELTVRALRGPLGHVSGWVLVVRDVSARASLEQDLRASEERYRGLVEGLDQGVFIAQGGGLVYANAALADLCGVAAEDLLGTPWRDRIESRDVLVADAALAALEAGERERVDLLLTLRGDGAGRPPLQVRLEAATMRYEGQPAVFGMVEDVTAERRIDAELRRNESQLDAVVEATSDGILVLAGAGDGAMVNLTNHAFLELFGLGEGEVLGAREGRLLARLRAHGPGGRTLARMLAAPADEPRRETVTVGDPDAREIELLAARLRGRGGALLGKIVICRDLTPQRSVQQDLEAHVEDLERSKRALEEAYGGLNALNERLGLRGDELEKLNAELQTLDEMKTNLLGNVSHELQTPLVAIRGYTEMILKGRLGAITDEQQKGLRLSLKNIDRLISMIDNLLAFSRMDEDAAHLTLSTFSLQGLVEECAALMREPMESRRIRYASVYDLPGVEVHGDRDKLQQVLLNLISNAVKFNQDGGEIEVRVGAGAAGFASVRVSDTGVGIPDGDFERVFDRDFRASTGSTVEGSGLGLSIARDILRLHGCTIHGEARPGGGSMFSFTLPLAGEVVQRAGSGADSAPAVPGGAAGGPDSRRPGAGTGGVASPADPGGRPVVRPAVDTRSHDRPRGSAESVPNHRDRPPRAAATPPRPRLRIIRPNGLRRET